MADLNEIFGSDSENEEIESGQEEQVQNQESGDNNNSNNESGNEEEEENGHVVEKASGSEAGSNNNSEEEVEERKASENEDSDDEVISRKREKKNDVDVFGEELDDLSDDSDDNQPQERRDSDDDNNNDEAEETQAPVEEEEVEPEQVINIEMPKVNTDLGKELHFVKLPNFLSVEPRPFDPDTYEDDLLEKSETLDEEGQARVRLKVENTIRWRYEKDSDGNMVKQSNAKIVKWSDGSLSLYLGNEIFDVYKTLMQGDHNHLFVRQGNVLHGQTIFKTKLAFRPHSTDSMTHRKMTMSLVDRGSKTKKVKILTEIKRNPEGNRNELMKKEEEKLKAASRRQNQQRRMREKSHSKGLSANYLEDKYNTDDDDEDNGTVSLSAIKNKFKSRKEVYSSSDESENERRLNKAKDESDEDSDDDDIYTRKSGGGKKKKVVHHVSDDDDE